MARTRGRAPLHRIAMARAEGKDGAVGSASKEKMAKAPLEKPWGDGGSGDNKALQMLEFVIGSTFSSRLYVGSPELHLAVPLPRPEDYPIWFPQLLRIPKSVYEYVDRGVEEGWVKKAAEESTFQIKYGVLRGEVQALADDKCEPCELERRKQLEEVAGRDLVNIDEAERSRRMNTGYAIAAASTVLGYLAIDLDGGPLARFPVAFMAVLGYAFIESGKNGL